MKINQIFILLILVFLNLNLVYSNMKVTFTEEDFTLNNAMIKDGHIQLAYTDYGFHDVNKKRKSI